VVRLTLAPNALVIQQSALASELAQGREGLQYFLTQKKNN